ncbi:MAG: metal ABC transporter permease [Pseudomonadota bacterium]
MDVLLSPFEFGFMQRAFALSFLVGIPTALLSCFLVVRGWALLGDAVSHSVLPGVVLAYIFGLPLLLGAFVAAMFCAIASGYISDNSRIKPDTAMGVVFSGMFGLGIVLYTAIETDIHLDHILFGNLLGVEQHELWTSALIGSAVILGLAIFWRDLRFQSFDPAQAQLLGINVNMLHYGLLSALALTIVATLAATGLIRAIGLLIAPGAIALLITRTFAQMMLVSVLVCLFSLFAGVYLSFFLDSAPAATAVLVFSAMFILAFITKRISTQASLSAVVKRIT